MNECIFKTRDTMKCDVCKIDKSKYKCPKCRNINCSVACYQCHLSGDKCALSDQEGRAETSIKVLYPTKDTIPAEKLNLLCYDKRLREIVSNSHLQQILEKIDNSTSPNEELEKAMIEPIFDEFARRCLEIVKNENEN